MAFVMLCAMAVAVILVAAVAVAAKFPLAVDVVLCVAVAVCLCCCCCCRRDVVALQCCRVVTELLLLAGEWLRDCNWQTYRQLL